MGTRRLWAWLLLAAVSCRPRSVVEEAPVKPMNAGPKDPMAMTDAEWRQKLAPEQYRVLRKKGTEAPDSGAYLHHKGDGTYDCAACGRPLFDSKTKYDACGWPSYWDAIPGAVRQGGDGDDLEALCTGCGSHLGHVFDDGPPPTGKRY